MTTNSPKGKILVSALALFAPIHENERLTAVLMRFSMFVLLTAYYTIKPAREGGEGQAFLFLLIVPAYGRFATHVNRLRSAA